MAALCYYPRLVFATFTDTCTFSKKENNESEHIENITVNFVYKGFLIIHNLILRKAKERVRIEKLKKLAVNSTTFNVIANVCL